MAQYQSISLTYPKMHGSAPKNLAMVVNKPNAPKATAKFKSFKEVMDFLIKNEDEG